MPAHPLQALKDKAATAPGVPSRRLAVRLGNKLSLGCVSPGRHSSVWGAAAKAPRDLLIQRRKEESHRLKYKLSSDQCIWGDLLFHLHSNNQMCAPHPYHNALHRLSPKKMISGYSSGKAQCAQEQRIPVTAIKCSQWTSQSPYVCFVGTQYSSHCMAL